MAQSGAQGGARWCREDNMRDTGGSRGGYVDVVQGAGCWGGGGGSGEHRVGSICSTCLGV